MKERIRTMEKIKHKGVEATLEYIGNYTKCTFEIKRLSYALVALSQHKLRAKFGQIVEMEGGG